MESNGTVKQIGPQKKVLYGLPCAQCKIYYAAALTSCPVCHCRERVPALGVTELPPLPRGCDSSHH